MAFKMKGWKAYTTKDHSNNKPDGRAGSSAFQKYKDSPMNQGFNWDKDSEKAFNKLPKVGDSDKKSARKMKGFTKHMEKQTKKGKGKSSPFDQAKRMTKTKTDKLYKKDGGVIDRPKHGMGYIKDAVIKSSAEGMSEALTQAQINKMKNTGAGKQTGKSKSHLKQKPGFLEELKRSVKSIPDAAKKVWESPGKSAGDRRASADRKQELREFRDKNPEQFKKSARELPKGHVYDPDADAYKRHMDRYMPEKAQKHFAEKKKAKLAEMAANKDQRAKK